MTTAVLVTRDAPNHFTARALAFADIHGSGPSEAEAIAALTAQLLEIQMRSHIVHVDIPLPIAPDDPWLRVIGMAEHDPSWDDFQRAIAADRQAIDAAERER